MSQAYYAVIIRSDIVIYSDNIREKGRPKLTLDAIIKKIYD